jgi:hypothetical protein
MRELAVIGNTGGAERPALIAGAGSLRPCASCPNTRLNFTSRSSGFRRGQNDGTGRAFVDQDVVSQRTRAPNGSVGLLRHALRLSRASGVPIDQFVGEEDEQG